MVEISERLERLHEDPMFDVVGGVIMALDPQIFDTLVSPQTDAELQWAEQRLDSMIRNARAAIAARGGLLV